MQGATRTFLLAGFFAILLGTLAQDDHKPTTSTTKAPDTTTTATTTSTTTAAPTTTTKGPTTTTVAPKHYPNNEGKWTVEDKQNVNVSCILLQGALEVSIVYQDSQKKNQTLNMDIPDVAKATGDCKLGQMTLTWNSSNSENSLTFSFEANQTTSLGSSTGVSAGKYALQNITGTFSNLTEPGKLFKFELTEKAAFQTPFNHSYSCLAQETLRSADQSVTVKFSDFRVEAFRNTTVGHKEFSAAIDCLADDASDAVPIAVGASLAGLVVIVFIAYLIGRRRSRARGYQSV